MSRLPGRDAAAAAVLNLTCCSVIRTVAEDASVDGAADCVTGTRFSPASPATVVAGGEFRISLVSIALVSLCLLATRRHLTGAHVLCAQRSPPCVLWAPACGPASRGQVLPNI